MATVTLGDLVFRSDATTGYVYTKLRGWYSGAPVRADATDRPNADGSFGSVKNYRSARPLQFEGALFSDTAEEAVGELWAAFSSLQSDGVPFTLSVTDALGTLSCTVTLNGSPDIDELNEQSASVSAPLLAYDPVKYGPTVEYTTGLPAAGGGLEYPLGEPSGALYYGSNGDLGRVSVSNVGTADVWPSFTVSGELADGFFVL